MQLKEAIDYLRPIMENARLDGYHLALRKVLEAAELQIAKEPEEHNNFYRCPNCQNALMGSQCNCDDCGQLIKWRKING